MSVGQQLPCKAPTLLALAQLLTAFEHTLSILIMTDLNITASLFEEWIISLEIMYTILEIH